VGVKKKNQNLAQIIPNLKPNLRQSKIFSRRKRSGHETAKKNKLTAATTRLSSMALTGLERFQFRQIHYLWIWVFLSLVYYGGDHFHL